MRNRLSPIDVSLLEHCFGDPGEEQAKVRAIVRRNLIGDAGLGSSWASLDEVWAKVMASTHAETLEASYQRVAVALEEHARVLELVEDELGRQLAICRADGDGCPWIVEIPAELIAGFVAARSELGRRREHAMAYKRTLQAAREQPRRFDQTGLYVQPDYYDRDSLELWLLDSNGKLWPLRSDGRITAQRAESLRERIQNQLRYQDRAGACQWHDVIVRVDFGVDRQFSAERIAQKQLPMLVSKCVDAAIHERSERLKKVGDINVGRCDRQAAITALTQMCEFLREKHPLVPRAQPLPKPKSP
jgi:hypothetical protein